MEVRDAVSKRLHLRLRDVAVIIRSRLRSGHVLALLLLAGGCGRIEAVGAGADASPDVVVPTDEIDANVPPADAAPETRDASVVDAPPYPNCLSADRPHYRCDATQTCVRDCAACAGATNHCLLASVVRGGSVLRCVASCATCETSTLERPATCGRTCTNLGTDDANCGSCGNTCAANQACNEGQCEVTK